MPSYGKFKFNVTNATAANTTLTTQAKGMHSPLPKGPVEGDNETVATTVLSEKGTTNVENLGKKTSGDGITKSVENVTPSGASAAEEETSKRTTVADDTIKNGTTGLTGTTKIGTADVDDVTLKRTTIADDLVTNEKLKTPGDEKTKDSKGTEDVTKHSVTFGDDLVTKKTARSVEDLTKNGTAADEEFAKNETTSGPQTVKETTQADDSTKMVTSSADDEFPKKGTKGSKISAKNRTMALNDSANKPAADTDHTGRPYKHKSAKLETSQAELVLDSKTTEAPENEEISGKRFSASFITPSSHVESSAVSRSRAAPRKSVNPTEAPPTHHIQAVRVTPQTETKGKMISVVSRVFVTQILLYTIPRDDSSQEMWKKDYKGLEKSHENDQEKGSSTKSTYFTVNSQKSFYADANFFCHISLNE